MTTHPLPPAPPPAPPAGACSVTDASEVAYGGHAPAPAPPATATPVAAARDDLYRRFYVAGIAVALTAGALWGAYLLLRIAAAGSFTGVSIHHVNAHGQAQIVGWMGLFIMGFAYQGLPRFWGTRLVGPGLAPGVFVITLVGLVLSTFAMPLAGQAWAALAALVGGVLITAGVATFAVQMVWSFVRSGGRVEPWTGFVLAALGWFVIQAVGSAWHNWNVMTAPGRGEVLWYVAAFQAPLRNVQLHGLALFMILGVSMRLLPQMLGVAPTSRRRGWIALALLIAAVVAEVVLFIAYRFTGERIYTMGLLGAWVALAVGVGLVAWPWRLWRAPLWPDRSAKFVRMAYLWLAISMVMLLLLPAYQAMVSQPFSHAYYGAVRHAFTVGFISMMIMGVAARAVPSLVGVDARTLTRLWGPFILINLGCAMRVGLQGSADVTSQAYALVGVSGVLELTALAWWGAHLLGLMYRGRRAHEEIRETCDCCAKSRALAQPSVAAS